MKRVTVSRQAFIVIGALVSMVASADIPKHSASYYETQKPEVQEAWRKGAKAKIIYRIVNDASNSRTLAHELGHACNLPDIYNDVGNGDGSPLIGRLQEEDMPFDWNNGVGPEFFPAYDTLYNVIPLLLMYGFESDYKADIPGGAILGFADAESDVGIQVPALRQVGRMLLNRSPRSR